MVIFCFVYVSFLCPGGTVGRNLAYHFDLWVRQAAGLCAWSHPQFLQFDGFCVPLCLLIESMDMVVFPEGMSQSHSVLNI